MDEQAKEAIKLAEAELAIVRALAPLPAHRRRDILRLLTVAVETDTLDLIRPERRTKGDERHG